MGFGLSGDDDRTKMVGGDVTVAWMDHSTGKGHTYTHIYIYIYVNERYLLTLKHYTMYFQGKAMPKTITSMLKVSVQEEEDRVRIVTYAKER